MTDKDKSVPSSDLLADIFATSAELRFYIKSLNLPRVEQNSSWHKHTEVMRRVEVALKSANAEAQGRPPLGEAAP